jgi:hypothetical protein
VSQPDFFHTDLRRNQIPEVVRGGDIAEGDTLIAPAMLE